MAEIPADMKECASIKRWSIFPEDPDTLGPSPAYPPSSPSETPSSPAYPPSSSKGDEGDGDAGYERISRQRWLGDASVSARRWLISRWICISRPAPDRTCQMRIHLLISAGISIISDFSDMWHCCEKFLEYYLKVVNRIGYVFCKKHRNVWYERKKAGKELSLVVGLADIAHACCFEPQSSSWRLSIRTGTFMHAADSLIPRFTAPFRSNLGFQLYARWNEQTCSVQVHYLYGGASNRGLLRWISCSKAARIVIRLAIIRTR